MPKPKNVTISIDDAIAGLSRWHWGDDVPEYLRPVCEGAATIVLQEFKAQTTNAYVYLERPNYEIEFSVFEGEIGITIPLKQLVEKASGWCSDNKMVLSFAQWLHETASNIEAEVAHRVATVAATPPSAAA